MSGTSPVVRQTGYRSRDDTELLNSTTWPRAQNTDWSQNVDEVFRLRLLLSDSVASTKTSNYTFGLEFNIGGGSFSAVQAGAAVQPALSGQFADDDAVTSSQITGGQNSFVNGFGDENGAAPSAGNVTLGNGSDHTEMEFALLIDSAQVSDSQVIQIRATGVNATATQTPSITVVEGAAAHELTADDIATGTPTLTSAALGQTHALLADDIATGTPTLTSPVLAEVHVLAADDLVVGTPTLTSSALGQTHVLTADDAAAGTPTLTAAAIGQTHALLADDLSTETPTLTSPVLSQGGDTLTADDLTAGTPTLTVASLGQTHVLLADDIAADAPTLSNPVLTIEGEAGDGPVYTAPTTTQAFRGKKRWSGKHPPYYWQAAPRRELRELKLPADTKAQKVVVEAATEIDEILADLERRDKNFDRMLAQVDRLIERTHALVENFHIAKLLAETKSRIEAAKDAEQVAPKVLVSAEQLEIEELTNLL